MTIGKAKKILRGFLAKDCYYDTPLYYAIPYLLDYITNLQEELEEYKEIEKSLNKECDTYMKIATKRGNIINELEKSINNFDVFKEFTFPLMKRDVEQQIKSSIDYEWRKSIKEPFLNKLKELKGDK